jgi:hypothetical protein
MLSSSAWWQGVNIEMTATIYLAVLPELNT